MLENTQILKDIEKLKILFKKLSFAQTNFSFNGLEQFVEFEGEFSLAEASGSAPVNQIRENLYNHDLIFRGLLQISIPAQKNLEKLKYVVVAAVLGEEIATKEFYVEKSDWILETKNPNTQVEDKRPYLRLKSGERREARFYATKSEESSGINLRG